MTFLIGSPGGNEWLFVILIIIGAMFILPQLFPPRYLNNDKVPVFEVVLSLLLLITFFLPWASWGIVVADLTISGYDIPIKVKQLFQTENIFSKNPNDDWVVIVFASYLLFSIPIFSLATIILGLSRKNKSSNFTARLASVIPVFIGILALLIFSSKSGIEAFRFLDFGFYAMIFLGFALWINAMWSGRTRPTETMTVQEKSVTQPANKESLNRNELLQQLSQLYSLKQSGVITETIYETQRLQVLEALENKKSETITTKDEPQDTSLEYERLFGNEARRSKMTWVYALIIIGVIGIVSYFLFETTKKKETTSIQETSLTEESNTSKLENSYSISEPKSDQGCNGTYNLLQDFECGIVNGGLVIDKPKKGRFHFSLSVSGADHGDEMTMSGKVEGVAKFISKDVAIFSDGDCKKLQFKFIELGTVRLTETECSYYHGAGICFDASFMKP